ncbi:MAG: T9SS type A sorting domain-containing protein [Crocinitomix sp.]|nr:T9SS type A sorting domain-containing protein [Crocinitomix sp.]
MKRLLIGLLLILFSAHGWTQNVRLDWAVSAGNPPLQDYSFGLSVDDSGNVYTTGSYALTADLDPGPGVDEYTSMGGADIYIHKLDNDGNFVWVKSIGGTSNDIGAEIVTDTNGNVYLTGYYSEEADFDPNDEVLNLISNGSADIFVMKLDSLGNLIWATSMGGPLVDRGIGIAIDDVGNVYTTGFFEDTVDFDPGIGTHDLIAEGTVDVFVLKLDVDGNFLWANAYGGTEDDAGSEIHIDNSNNVCVTGYYHETIDFNPEGIPALHTALGLRDGFILKLDSDGNYLWSHSIGGIFNLESAQCLTSDLSENLYVVGTFSSTVDFDPGPGDSTITAGGYTDGYILKLSNDGDFIWVRTITGEEEVNVTKVILNAENEIFTVGKFSEVVDFDPSEGVYELDANGFNDDTYLLKLNASGEFSWVKHYNSNDRSIPYGLDIDDSSNIFMSGFFEGTMDFDPGPDTLELEGPLDNDDFFILKMAPCTPHETTDTIEACNSFTWINDIEYFESTSDPIFIMADTSGCDSIISLHLTILPSSSTTDNIEACDAYTWIDGIEYTEDNDEATFTLTNEFGCDSVVALNLTILSSSTGIDVQIACDSLLWTDGIMYYEDNFVATDTFVNAVGCDSVVTLNLIVNYSNTGIDELVVCDSLVWIDGVTYCEDNDAATFSLSNVSGCDSVVALNLVVNYSSSGTDEQTACDSYVWIDGIEYFEDNTSATFTLTNAVGCDSVVTLNLDIDPINIGVTNDDPTLTSLETYAEYQWLDCLDDFSEIPGATGVSFVPEDNGEYAVEVTKLECVDTSDCYVIVTAGVVENGPLSGVKIYPNPSSGFVYVDLGELLGVSIQVYAVSGELVYQAHNVEAKIYTFELDVEAGVYFVEITAAVGSERFKLLIKK